MAAETTTPNRRNAYLNRIATTPVADLIAAEVELVKHRLKQHYTTFTSYEVSPAKAAENQRRIDAAVAELREIWRLAHRGGEAWRPRLTAFCDAYEHTGRLVRYRLIVEHAPQARPEPAQRSGVWHRCGHSHAGTAACPPPGESCGSYLCCQP